jgi:quercetin dioxygenase-like cupin family protein
MKRAMVLVGILLCLVCGMWYQGLNVEPTAQASPPVGVTPTVLARGTYGDFNVKSSAPYDEGFKFEAKASKAGVDLIVRQHEYGIDASTGWHRHPGPVFITVTHGTLTFYEYDDPTCTPIVVPEGHGYVDTGRGHLARNESGAPATDISVISAPVGKPFRSELDAPAPHCPF